MLPESRVGSWFSLLSDCGFEESLGETRRNWRTVLGLLP